MSEYIVSILGRLRPPLTVEYRDLEFPSFSITIDNETVNAVPHPDLQLDADEAKKRLQDEISPLLLVFGFELENQAITLDVTDVIFQNFKTGIRSIPTSVALSRPLPTKDELLQKVRWAASDPTYCDLLDYYLTIIGRHDEHLTHVPLDITWWSGSKKDLEAVIMRVMHST